ncbi:MAG TPA: peptidoglycan editing factor PgeF [Acidimicrobiales bacterium]
MPIDVVLKAELRNGLTIYPVESVVAFGVDAFVTDRFGGVSSSPYDSLNLGDHVGDRASDVEENRRRVAHAASVDPMSLVIVRQVHGADVMDASLASETSEADGLVTESDDVVLAMLVADCLPILLADRSSRRFALVHAGWRGLSKGVLSKALDTFENSATVHAFIGPSISREAYQVGPDVAQHFTDVENALMPDGEDRSRLDLRRVAIHQLRQGGVADESIGQSRQVTDGGEVFFSDRAQRPCGRFAVVAKRAS